jgi:hypothetical protein
MGVRDGDQESNVSGARAEGPWSSLTLETIGWKAFQDLCSQVCEEVLRRPVQIYREAQDGGQDAVFIVEGPNGAVDATVQCKHSSDPRRRLKGAISMTNSTRSPSWLPPTKLTLIS